MYQNTVINKRFSECEIIPRFTIEHNKAIILLLSAQIKDLEIRLCSMIKNKYDPPYCWWENNLSQQRLMPQKIFAVYC